MVIKVLPPQADIDLPAASEYFRKNDYRKIAKFFHSACYFF